MPVLRKSMHTLVQLSTPYSATIDSFDLPKIDDFTEKMTGYRRLSYIKFITQPDGPEFLEQHPEAAWTAMHGLSPATDPQRWMTMLFCRREAMREFLLSDGSTPSRASLRDYAKDSELKSYWMEAIESGGMRAPDCWYHALASNVHWEVEMRWAAESKRQRGEGESP